MNAGFSSLTYLKSQLLAEALRQSEDYDDVILNIGRGVAAQFDQFCNRQFARATGAEAVFPADNPTYFLPRYPVETITSVELSESAEGGYTALSGVVLNSNPANGAVFFGTALGAESAVIRITYTGGYWYDDSEDATGTLPAGATELPPDIRMAWLLQCAEVWGQRDVLGTGLAAASDKKPSLKSLELLPQAKEVLSRYIRYSII